MKVACIGNMNNNMFCLTRYLRDREIDATLFLLSQEQKHFLPESDSYSNSYLTYTKQLSWGSENDFTKTSKDQIVHDLSGYDVILACNYAPAFLYKADIHIDIFLPHGSDYYDVPFYSDNEGKPTLLADAQLNGIKNSDFIFIPKMNEEQERVWDMINPSGEFVYLPVPIIYTPEYSDRRMAEQYRQNDIFKQIVRLRKKHDFMIFHHVRHCWTPSSPKTEHKGNDILLIGLAKYIKHSGKSPILVTAEYGRDVGASKKLIQELGIVDNVFWFQQLPRKQIMPLLAECHLVAVEFAYSWIAGGVLDESMCMEKPILCRRDDEYYKGVELFSALLAENVSEVYEALCSFQKSADFWKLEGKLGRRWLETKILNPTIDAVVGIINKQRGVNG